MLHAMRFSRDDGEVFNAVVVSDAVDVMDDLGFEKGSPEMLFHDVAML